MVNLGGWVFLMSEVPLYSDPATTCSDTSHEETTVLSSDDVFQETSARYRAVEQEQWLQRQPEAGSSWPSWPRASHRGLLFLMREVPL